MALLVRCQINKSTVNSTAIDKTNSDGGEA